MNDLFQTFVAGLRLGCIYGLVALGYTMVYGVLRFINFAHGDIVMVGAWLCFIVARAMHWTGFTAHPPLYAAAFVLLISMTACALLGWLTERLAYRPLRRAPRLNVLIAAIGVSLFIENAGQLRFLFGTEPQAMPSLLPRAQTALITLLGVRITVLDVVIGLLAVGLMIALDILVFRTRLGLAMRAVAFDDAAAALTGVPVNRVVGMTFIIGSALAAAGGFIFATEYHNLQQPAEMSWILLGLKAFVAAVVGGIGNIRGAMVGGLLLALLEQFGGRYVSNDLRDVYVFAILILVLLVKPGGIMGAQVTEKV